MMKTFLFLCTILLASYFGYAKFVASDSSADSGKYSLVNVVEQPIPMPSYFELWKDVALEQCANAKEKKNNSTPEQCRKKVSERHSDCERSSATGAPEKVSDKAISKQLGDKYLACVTASVFCGGAEVQSEGEARKLNQLLQSWGQCFL